MRERLWRSASWSAHASLEEANVPQRTERRVLKRHDALCTGKERKEREEKRWVIRVRREGAAGARGGREPWASDSEDGGRTRTMGNGSLYSPPHSHLISSSQLAHPGSLPPRSPHAPLLSGRFRSLAIAACAYQITLNQRSRPVTSAVAPPPLILR
ncbi:hypothetical protein FKP32DRAFT_1298992 [Trametes sanguinea]|nr:hypothetical protein FKP32DRAFT_1298992 [Trametes sanguinea]